MLVGHGAEQSRARTTYGGDGEGRRRCGAADELDDEAGREAFGDGGWARVRRRRDELDGRAGLGDGGEIEDGDGGGEDRRVDRKVEDEQNRNRLIYIGRDPLVLAGKTNQD